MRNGAQQGYPRHARAWIIMQVASNAKTFRSSSCWLFKRDMDGLPDFLDKLARNLPGNFHEDAD